MQRSLRNQDETLMPVTLYHNPRCSKSRGALKLLRSRDAEPEVIEYLKSPPSADELDRILVLLDMDPRALMRTKESACSELLLDAESPDRHTPIEAMVEHPILMQRAIAVTRERAAHRRRQGNVLGVL